MTFYVKKTQIKVKIIYIIQNDNNELLFQKRKQIEDINKYTENRDKIMKEIEEKKC